MTTGSKPLIRRDKTAAGPNHWRLIWAIARKDIIESVNNSQLIVMTLMPIIIFLIYRLMVSGINNSSILDIAVYDLGNSHLVAAMSQNPELDLHTVSNETELQERINQGEMSGLRIPDGFDEAVAAGGNPTLTIWLNPPSGLQAETTAWQRFIEAEILKLGQQTLPAQIEWVEVESSTTVASRALDSYLLVVVLTLILFMMGANVVAMLIAEEKEKKTAVMLLHSPASPYHIMWGKAIAGVLFIAFVSAIVILINGGLTGNWPLALLYLLLGLPVAVSAGILVGSLAQSAKQCNGWLGLGTVLFLSPAWFFTLLKLPEPFATIIHSIPSHFMVRGLNDALTQTGIAADNTTNLTLWIIFSLVIVALTIWRVRQNPQSIII